jgi:hypothetical protein
MRQWHKYVVKICDTDIQWHRYTIRVRPITRYT